MNKFLVDSDVIVDYLRDKKEAVSFLSGLEKISISTITAGEILQGVSDKQELRVTKDFLLKFCDILPLDEEISRLALQLLEKYVLAYGLLILDALIAATAIKYNLTLKTGNLKHFQMINNLRIEAP